MSTDLEKFFGTACILVALVATPTFAISDADCATDNSCLSHDTAQQHGNALLQIKAPQTNLNGMWQPLNDFGYGEVRKMCCTKAMTTFIIRLVESKGGKVCPDRNGGPGGLAAWHDCKEDKRDFKGLLDSIAPGSLAEKGECPWLTYIPGPCPPMGDDCPHSPGFLKDCKPLPEEPVTEKPVTEKPDEPVTEKPDEPVTEKPVTEKPDEPVTEKPDEPVTEKPDETAAFCSSAGHWEKGECQKSPKDCTPMTLSLLTAGRGGKGSDTNGGRGGKGSGGSVASTTDCGELCGTRSGGCCYFHPKGDENGVQCKWCSGATGGGNPNKGRYQCIVE